MPQLAGIALQENTATTLVAQAQPHAKTVTSENLAIRLGKQSRDAKTASRDVGRIWLGEIFFANPVPQAGIPCQEQVQRRACHLTQACSRLARLSKLTLCLRGVVVEGSLFVRRGNSAKV